MCGCLVADSDRHGLELALFSMRWLLSGAGEEAYLQVDHVRDIRCFREVRAFATLVTHRFSFSGSFVIRPEGRCGNLDVLTRTFPYPVLAGLV